MTLPLASAIVPIYNHAQFVEGCLESLARQDYPRLEVIAIDDGSSDDSHGVAQRWFERNGHRFERWILRRQENVGITRTCNRLIALAHGELIFPLASDDEAMDGALSALVPHHHPSQPRILFSDVGIIDGEGNLLASGTREWRGRDVDRLARSSWYLRWQLLTAWGTPFQHQVFPRSLYERFDGYDESLKFEDASFALRAAAIGAICFVPIVTRRYRVRPGSSPTPGIAEEDWTLVPSRNSVRHAFGPVLRAVLALLNRRDALPKRSLVRRAITAGLDSTAFLARIVGR